MKTVSHEEELVICKNCQTQLHHMVQSGLFSEEELTILHNPARVITVNFHVHMDNKTTRLISGFRVQYNDILGPTKGGMRMHPESDVEEVTELSFLMTLKTALLGLPYGGAKGAIRINPKTLSLQERERVVRGYTSAIAKFIGPDVDIPAPDVHTGPQEMAWLRDEYEKIVGQSAPAVVTGKSLDNDGSLGRDVSTALGGFYIILDHLQNNLENNIEKEQLSTPKKMTVAIQGFGNVGAHLATFLDQEGLDVIAVSDSNTGLYDEDGLSIQELTSFKKDGGSFENRKEHKISNEDLLELPVDILIPAALGGVITLENVKRVHAKLIVEMANAPITPEADSVLEKQSVTVIPDILANAGGVVVSYFEWKQNKSDEKWSLEDVNNKLKTYMLNAYKEVTTTAEKEHINERKAAYTVALRRILNANLKTQM